MVLDVVSAVVFGLCTGLIGVSLARLPRSPVSIPVYCFVGCGVVWAVGDLIAQTSSDMTWKQVGVSMFYSGAIPMPALWWCLVLRWSDEVGARLPFRARAWTAIPFAFAGLMWLAMITNPWHGQFLIPVVGGRNLYQPLWYAMSLPSYGLILVALGVELEVARRVAGGEVRRQAAFLIAASLVTLLGNVVYVSELVPVNLTAVMLSVSGALLLVGMAREGLFGVLPAAFPAIVADHPDGVVVAGRSGNIRFANKRARELLAPIEIHAENSVVDVFRDARLQPDSPGLVEALGDAHWWEAVARLDSMTFRLNAGDQRWLSVTASVVQGRRGTKGLYLQINDLTMQKQAELHLRQARRLESVASFARGVSRELQSSLSIVHGNGELLSRDATLAPRRQRQVGRILDAAKRGVTLAYELQLYTGTFTTRRVLLELSEIAEESCRLVESDLPGDVQLVLLRTAEALPVHVDAFQIRHAVYNLLTNAIEAMSDRAGAIEVETGSRFFAPAKEDLVCGEDQPPGEFAYVSIRDEGGGMDPATEERAFEPFFSTRGKDRGDGLPTVLGIARAHGALLRLESGDGCVLTLCFPLERSPGG